MATRPARVLRTRSRKRIAPTPIEQKVHQLRGGKEVPVIVTHDGNVIINPRTRKLSPGERLGFVTLDPESLISLQKSGRATLSDLSKIAESKPVFVDNRNPILNVEKKVQRKK